MEHPRKTEMRVLVANSPRSYREAFAGIIRILRPRVEVVDAEPEELEEEISAVQPDLVICDHIPFAVKANVPYWIEMRVENEVLVVNSDTCGLPNNTNPDVYQLLSIIDRTEELTHRGGVEHQNLGSKS